MGTDINLYIEVWDTKRQKWVFVEEIWIGRNYNLFAILADVRNLFPSGLGFLEDLKIGKKRYNPICMPKGIPEDISETVKEEYYEFNHSASFLTLEELENTTDYWNQTAIERGHVTFEQYKEFKQENTLLDWWCGGIVGGNTKLITNEEADELIKNPELQNSDLNYYTTIDFDVSYKGEANVLWNDIIPRMRKILVSHSNFYDIITNDITSKKLLNKNNVRIVFWFNS